MCEVDWTVPLWCCMYTCSCTMRVSVSHWECELVLTHVHTLYYILYLSVCVFDCSLVCLYITMYICKKSSTHHPSSQVWASRCLVLCMFVCTCIAFICLGSWASPFFCLSSTSLTWCAIHMWFHVLCRYVWCWWYMYVVCSDDVWGWGVV